MPFLRFFLQNTNVYTTVYTQKKSIKTEAVKGFSLQNKAVKNFKMLILRTFRHFQQSFQQFAC